MMNYKNTLIKVLSQVYEPSEDSFLLAETALSEIKGSESVLEVGCGSGIISTVIQSNTKARVVGIDINPYAAACTKINGVDSIIGNLLSCIKGKFDVIIFNPPYLPTEKEARTTDWINTAIDGGSNGRETINIFLEEAGNRLVDNGRILMVISSLTGIEEVKSRMESLNYEVVETMQERFMFEKLAVIKGTRKSNFNFRKSVDVSPVTPDISD
jgi:release factor glutamine methyltransferase